jgi:hypothetical protein
MKHVEHKNTMKDIHKRKYRCNHTKIILDLPIQDENKPVRTYPWTWPLWPQGCHGLTQNQHIAMASMAHWAAWVDPNKINVNNQFRIG